MDIKAKMNGRFRDLQGGLFLEVTKADVGEGAGNFMKAGGDHHGLGRTPSSRTRPSRSL